MLEKREELGQKQERMEQLQREMNALDVKGTQDELTKKKREEEGILQKMAKISGQVKEIDVCIFGSCF